jgi:hypothetical protein
MRLVYCDESGNTGNNLDDQDQPILVVGALIVPEECWQSLESDLELALAERLPAFNPLSEVHSSDLRRGAGPMKGIPVAERVALRDAWLDLARHHALKFVYRSIEKKKYKIWQNETFGAGVAINPQIAAFALVSLVVNEFLVAQKALGIFIIDESKEVGRDVEKSIRQLRLTPGPLRLSQIIEKGFFIDSTKSRVLQLCDLCVLQARKLEEAKAGSPKKPFDVEGIRLVQPLIHRGNEQLLVVLDWLKAGRVN